MKVKTAPLLLLAALSVAAADTVAIRGAAEDTEGKPVAGVKLFFLLSGSSEKREAASGADGAYSISLPAGEYEIQLLFPGQVKPHSGQAWLGGRPEIALNVRVPKDRAEGHFEYDALAEWEVTDESGRGIGPARVTFEALQRNSRRSRFPVYIPVADDEKETDGSFSTSPDGRIIFRIRESHILPDKVVGLAVTASAPGFQENRMTIYPALQFSETGHLFAAYPEDGVKLKLTRR